MRLPDGRKGQTITPFILLERNKAKFEERPAAPRRNAINISVSGWMDKEPLFPQHTLSKISLQRVENLVLPGSELRKKTVACLRAAGDYLHKAALIRTVVNFFKYIKRIMCSLPSVDR